MKPEFEAYIRDLEASDVLVEKIDKIMTDFFVFLIEEPDTVFITDYFDNEGKRHLENLWFISQEFAVECKSIETTENWDVVRIPERILRIDIKKHNYDMKIAEKDSRLSVNVFLAADLTCGYKAAAENCNVLREILVKYFFPRI